MEFKKTICHTQKGRRLMKPLITFILFAYNQERFIREALESALAQTYSPLEIIVFDDFSTDNTFQIIQRIALEYHGRHILKVFRNSINLGIGGSVNNAIESSKGDLIVFAAGDDISLPNRTDILFEAWKESGRNAMGVFSSHIRVCENGKEYGIGGTRGYRGDMQRFRRLDGNLFSWLSTREPMVNGCAAAWSPIVFKYFGPLQSDMEDAVLCFRALAIGHLYYIDQPLVKWRRHRDNASFYAREVIRSFEEREKRLRRVNTMTVAMYENIIDDIKILCEKGRISSSDADRLMTEATRVSKLYSLERDLMDKNFLPRLQILLNTSLRGNLRSALKYAPRALPVPIYRTLYMLRARMRSKLSVSAKPHF